MEDHMSRAGLGAAFRRRAATLGALLARNCECRDYDSSFAVGVDRLGRIVAAGEAADRSGRFVFRPVPAAEAPKLSGHIDMSPFSSPPEAFVAVCSAEAESRSLYIDLGAAVQSMLLQAVEIGLNGMRIDDFDRGAVAAELDLGYAPLLLLAVGRRAAGAVTASNR